MACSNPQCCRIGVIFGVQLIALRHHIHHDRQFVHPVAYDHALDRGDVAGII